MPTAVRTLDLSRSAPYFMTMLLVALVAFWPTYLSRVPASTAYTHLHAATATLWILLLISQPLAIRRRRMALHRSAGQASYFIAPLVLASIILLAHSRIQGLEGDAYTVQTYVLYLQMSLAFLFGLSYALAVAWRRRMALHSRFMICTALTLVDPITIRLMFWWDPMPGLNYNWITFAFTDLLLLALAWLDRRAPEGRWVFPAMLGLSVLVQLPVYFSTPMQFAAVTGSPAWQAFSAWFAVLPLG